MSEHDDQFSTNTPMSLHTEVESLLEAYIASELEPLEQTVVKQHLTECEICQQSLKEIQHIRHLLATLGSRGHTRQQAGISLADGVMAALQTPEHGPLLTVATSSVIKPLAQTANVFNSETPQSPHAQVKTSEVVSEQEASQKRRKRTGVPYFRPAGKWQQRLGGIAAGIILALLVGSMIVVFNLAHQSKSSSQLLTPENIYITHFNDIYKLDAKTRAIIWHQTFRKVNTLASEDEQPVVYSGVVYLSRNEGIYPSRPYLYALSAKDGSILWSRRFESKVEGQGDSTTDIGAITRPIIADGKLYVESEVGKVYALNAADGELLWVHAYPGLTGIPVITVNTAPGMIFLMQQHTIYAIDATNGVLRWTSQAVQYHMFLGSVMNNGIIFASSTPEPGTGMPVPIEGYVYAINAHTGSRLWMRKLPTVLGGLSITPPVAEEDALSIYSYGDNTLYALEPQSGDILWSKKITDQFYPTIITQKVLYAQAVHLTPGQQMIVLLALNTSDGSVRWQHSTPLKESLQFISVSGGIAYAMGYTEIVALRASNGTELWHYQLKNININSVDFAITVAP